MCQRTGRARSGKRRQTFDFDERLSVLNDNSMDIDPKNENSLTAPKRHDVLWIPDGNVVLATDSFLFKVHKGVLSMQSSVFKDMFDLVDGLRNWSDLAPG